MVLELLLRVEQVGLLVTIVLLHLVQVLQVYIFLSYELLGCVLISLLLDSL